MLLDIKIILGTMLSWALVISKRTFSLGQSLRPSMLVDAGLSLCQDAAQRILEAKVSELQQARSTILDKDLHLEGALADADRLKALLAEQKEEVGLVCKWDTGQGSIVKVDHL